MATLVSPGVSVTVTDESFYGSAGAGTVPLIVIATSKNKTSPTGSGTAPGTVPNMANKLYLMTSQRELIQTFGNPSFVTVGGSAVHGHELNEYGLHAAYQYLGISNRAYVMRANINLDELEASSAAPKGAPEAGTYWFDLNNTKFGVFQSSGDQSTLDPFKLQPVTVFHLETDYDQDTGKPFDTAGEDGDFCVITAEATNRVFEKIAGSWYAVGGSAWKFNRSFVRGATPASSLVVGNSFTISDGTPTGTVTVSVTSTSVSQLVIDVNNAIAANGALNGKVSASVDSAFRFKINFSVDTLYVQNVSGDVVSALFGITLQPGNSYTQNSAKLVYSTANRVPQNSVAGDVWIKTTSVANGASFSMKYYNGNTGAWNDVPAPLYPNDAAATAALGSSPIAGTVYVRYNTEGTASQPIASHEFMVWTGSGWTTLGYEEDFVEPSTPPAEGTFWFNANTRADIMVCDGEHWLGYRHMYPSTDPLGVQLTSARPTLQSDGTPLVENDLWIDTSDTENYPALYRWNAPTRRWVAVDKTDQTSPYGIVFADARQDSGTGPFANVGLKSYSEEQVDLLMSDFVDPDCPDPRTYAYGTLLFNTRYSTNNVKEWKPNWFAEGGFDENINFTESTYNVGDTEIDFPPLTTTGRWVTASGKNVDGSPIMGRKAQRFMVVKELSSTLASNEDIRSELVYFNLLAAPGYPELIDEMITLNADQKEVAFIVGDTPARLQASGTAISNWAKNKYNAPSTGELGLTASSPYVGLYYPWGLSTNVDGSEVMVPPSTIALRTLAYSDSVGYPWLAPAGFTRGLVTNAASVGYLTDEGEYQPVILNQGQRDVIYENRINPIAFIPNRGLVVFGQKTLNPVSSARDRVNVARLENYLRYHLDNMSKPFLFEQNDSHTRDAFKLTIERLLSGIVGLRGIEDYVVVCDESNNTAERRNRNEMWADIVFIPTKAVEFIYLPVRIRASGDSLEL